MSVGRVIKEREASRFLLTVAYLPHTLPARGADGRIDLVSADVLEKAAWGFAERGFRAGVGHEDGHEQTATVVESSIHRGPKWRVTGPTGRTQTIRKGDWLVGMILSPRAWSRYRAGEFGGVSLQGNATRKPASAKALARLKG